MRMDTCCTVRSSISLTNYARLACPVSPLPSSLERSQPGNADTLLLALPDCPYAPCGGPGSTVLWLASMARVFASPRTTPDGTDCGDAHTRTHASPATRVFS